mgnify:CR=1 FL=1
MPKHWYNYSSCEDDFERAIVSYKQPYFMMYIYPQTKSKYKKYIEQCEIKCQRKFKKSLDKLIENPVTDEENEFLYYFKKGVPVNISDSTMNKICRYIESHFNNYTTNLKSSQDFDYTFMKTGRKCYNVHRVALEELYQEYLSQSREFSKYKTINKLNKSEALSRKQHIADVFIERSKEICPNDCERLDIILDICYQSESSKSFCWLVVGDLIIKKLKGELE